MDNFITYKIVVKQKSSKDPESTSQVVGLFFFYFIFYEQYIHKIWESFSVEDIFFVLGNKELSVNLVWLLAP